MSHSRDTRLSFSGYLAQLQTESERFAQVLADADPQAPVPTCPDWTVTDLLTHLTGVQSFWAAVVRGRLTSQQQVDQIERPEPAEQHECRVAQLRAATARLVAALEDTPPTTRAWTWSSEQTVGFTYRRQAHEAAMHRVDAELAAGVAQTPVDAGLAADGVDEALRVMFGGCPAWGTIGAVDEAQSVRVIASDTGASWLVRTARFTGVDPDGTAYDEPDIAVADSDPGTDAAATITGPAQDLLRWMWRRPLLGALRTEGSGVVLDVVEPLITQPIN